MTKCKALTGSAVKGLTSYRHVITYVLNCFCYKCETVSSHKLLFDFGTILYTRAYLTQIWRNSCNTVIVHFNSVQCTLTVSLYTRPNLFAFDV